MIRSISVLAFIVISLTFGFAEASESLARGRCHAVRTLAGPVTLELGLSKRNPKSAMWAMGTKMRMTVRGIPRPCCVRTIALHDGTKRVAYWAYANGVGKGPTQLSEQGVNWSQKPEAWDATALPILVQPPVLDNGAYFYAIKGFTGDTSAAWKRLCCALREANRDKAYELRIRYRSGRETTVPAGFQIVAPYGTYPSCTADPGQCKQKRG